MTNLTYSNTNGSQGEGVKKRTDVEYRSPEAVIVRGLFELPRDGHVSSLALTPDGCYVFAGFGGGEVRMYAQALNTVGAASRSGTIVAQIRSKGMFSNTKVECCVEASEDGRFVFAGMLRGSSEMLALDINDLPRWCTLPTTGEASMAASEYDLNRRIRTYAHSDGKLKGFGAAAIVRTGPDRSRWGDEYRLFCGRGVKNIHVWSFKPAYAATTAAVAENGGSDELGGGNNGGARAGSGGRKHVEWGSGGEWTCLYDTHTNGATVELVAFRNGGLEGITKSTDANVRVWDLSGNNNPAKPPFRDVSNSKDTRAVFGDYAYGGATALSLVKIDEPAAANRMEIGLPESGMNAQTGRSVVSSTRGKRHCRMLKDLAGTQDGRHVVMVCSDGTVLYHRHTREATILKLQPLEGLGFEEDTRPTVALTLVGRYGFPVLMIAGERGRCASTGPGGEEAGKRLELMALPFGSARDLDGLQAMKVCKWYGDWAPLGPWPEGRRLSMKDENSSSDEDEDDGDEDEDGDDDEDDEKEDAKDGEDEGEDNGEDERLGDGGKGSQGGRQGISLRERDRCDIRGPPTARELMHHEQGGWKVSREGSRGDGMDGAGRRNVREGLDVKAGSEANAKARRRNLVGGSIEARRSHTDRTGHLKSLAGVGSANDRPDGAFGEKIVGIKTNPDCASLLPPPRVSTPVPTWVEKTQPKEEDLERANGDDDHSEGDDSDDDSVRADDDVGFGRRKKGFSGLGVTYITPVASPSVGSESTLPAPVHGSNWSSGSNSRKRAPRGGEECLSGRASNDDSAATESSSPKEDDVAEGSGSRNVERHTTPACLTSHGLNIAAVANLRSNGSGVSLADFSAPKPRGSAEKSALGDLAAAAAAALAAATGGNLSESEDAAEEGMGREGGEMCGLGDELESSRRSGNGPTRLYYGHEKRDDIVKRDLFHPSPQPAEADGNRFRGSSSRNDDNPLVDSGTPVQSSSSQEDVHEKANNRVNGAGAGVGESGSGPGPGGRSVASAKRMGKKRIRDDWEKFSTGDDEGEKVESIRSVKARRGGSHTRPDEVVAVSERGNASTGASAGGHPDRFPPRDRRSRIAARVLRSSGSAFDLGALTKGFGAGGVAWTGDGQQQVERLSVVRISESDVGVVPAPVPAALASFLEMRQERRRREMTPVSLDQARARYGSCTARPPGRLLPFAGGATVPETSGPDRGANPLLDGKTALEATQDSRRDSSWPKSLAKSASEGSEGSSALAGSAGCVERFPNGEEESSSRLADVDVGNNSRHHISTAGPSPVEGTNGVVMSGSEDVGKDRDASRDAGSRQPPTDTPGQVTCDGGAVALVSKEPDCGNAAAPPSITEEAQQASATSNGLACGGSTGNLMSVFAPSKHPEGDDMEQGGEEEQALDEGPEVFPPPMEAVIEMQERAGGRGSGGGVTDRLYSAHCLEREAAARVFFEEQDQLRRRFQSAVDVLELDNAVESAGLGLRSGCRTAQTIKMRLKSSWKEACRSNEVHRCKSKEAHQATQRFQEQMRHVIRDHRELLREVLGRQRLEASALQMSQEMEVTKGSAPLLQVRSAFPGMFEEVARRHHIFP